MSGHVFLNESENGADDGYFYFTISEYDTRPFQQQQQADYGGDKLHLIEIRVFQMIFINIAFPEIECH